MGSSTVSQTGTITAFELGGRFKIGNDACPTSITATGFFGVNTLDPKKNYYYVDYDDPTTVSTLLSSLLCKKIGLPKVLANSGYPYGFESSFSLFGQLLPTVGIKIPAGFHLNGTLDILGLQGSASVTIRLPKAIKIEVALPPIDIGDGLLEMYESRNRRSRGPFLKADVSILPSVKFDVTASSYVSVLQISTETSIRFTDKIEFRVSGNMLNLAMADFTLTAPLGNTMKASFSVAGRFRNELYDRIADEFKRVLDIAAREANGAISSAQEEVDDAADKLQRERKKLSGAKSHVNRVRGKFQSVENALARKRRQGVCSLRKCRSSKLWFCLSTEVWFPWGIPL